MKRPLVALAGAALIAPLVVAAPAYAASGPQTIAGPFLSPLSLALDVTGDIYVTDNFAGSLYRVKGGASTPLYTTATPGNEVGAVSALLGSVTFAETTADGSFLKKVDPRGKVSTLADLGAYERAKNPDGKQKYGFTDLPADCAAQLPPSVPASYTGEVYSHPYATLGTPIGTAVADAGANALLTVDVRGTVRTLAAFPAQKLVLNEAALSIGMPECAIGREYAFEAVPTDVELGPDGWLYVTLLPGGPESPALGARGSVVKVSLLTGKVVTVARGLVTATNLAISPKGDVYVSELFGGRISVIRKGTSTAVPFREAALPGAVEWAPGGLYATVDSVPAFSEDPTAPPPTPAGTIVKFAW
jgi:DNA-binding beta-propeller fold protein YncE